VSTPAISVVPVTVDHPKLGLIYPFLVRRILKDGKDSQEPEANLREFLASHVKASPYVLLLAMVAGDGQVVGHTLAIAQAETACILQCRADGNVGDAVDRAIAMVENWAQTLSCTQVLVTSRNEAQWRKRGFRTLRYVMELSRQDPEEPS
jgi:hypothetical protein